MAIRLKTVLKRLNKMMYMGTDEKKILKRVQRECQAILSVTDGVIFKTESAKAYLEIQTNATYN